MVRVGSRAAGVLGALAVFLGSMLAGCGPSVPAAPDFDLSLTPATQNVALAGDGTFTLSLVPHGGFDRSVTLSLLDAGGAPAFGASLSPSTVSLAAGQSKTVSVTVAAASSLPVGTFNFTLRAAGGGVTHTADLSLAVTGNPSAHGTFAAPSGSQATGGYPVAVTSGDFNGDGVPDLATADSPSGVKGSSTVLLGDGSGSFTAPSGSPYTVGYFPTGVAAGDLNGDGIPDLAIANSGDTDVSVLLGKADGSFQLHATYSVGSGPYAVAMADLNGDGKLDLVTGNGGSSTLGVLLNTSSGGVLSFSAPTGSPYALGFTPKAIAAGDLNGDGSVDVALADINANAWVVLGNGDGTLQASAATSYAVGQTPWSMAAADFNGDGKLDLAVANHSSNTVSVLLNAGTGGTLDFASAVDYDAGSGPAWVSVGDFDADGNLDLAVVDNGDGSVSILLGAGDGTFPTSGVPAYTAGGGVMATAVGDFDGDGILDLAVVPFASPATASVLLGQ